MNNIPTRFTSIPYINLQNLPSRPLVQAGSLPAPLIFISNTTHNSQQQSLVQDQLVHTPLGFTPEPNAPTAEIQSYANIYFATYIYIVRLISQISTHHSSILLLAAFSVRIEYWNGFRI
jgi:hypothetical protein